MHPESADNFEWDEHNESKLIGHGVQPWEVEEVFDNEPVWALNKNHASGDWLMVGRTNGGRALKIVITVIADQRAIRPITGWDCSTGDLTRYFKKGRK